MYNVVKWSSILQKSCSVYTARFLKYVWPFYNIMHERVNAGKCHFMYRRKDTANGTSIFKNLVMKNGKEQKILGLL